MPKISVIMPVCNAATYIAEAIESILTQTFSDFEFIILADPCRDQTIPIIKEIQQTDTRIRLIENDRRQGIAKCLNLGLAVAQGDYIARMDVDDISLPIRLEKQHAFMEKNSAVGLCGTSYYAVLDGRQYSWDLAADPRSELFLRCAILHPSVMFRHEYLKRFQLFYDEGFLYTEDYEFWTRLKHSLALANLPEKLMIYKKHAGQASVASYKNGMQYTRIVHLRNIWELGIQPTKEELDVQQCLSCMGEQIQDINKKQVDAWIAKVIAANDVYKVYPAAAFQASLQASRARIFPDGI